MCVRGQQLWTWAQERPRNLPQSWVLIPELLPLERVSIWGSWVPWLFYKSLKRGEGGVRVALLMREFR